MGFPSPGTGLPAGGASGQVVAKTSSADYAFGFITINATPTPPNIVRAVSAPFAATVTPNADTTDILNIAQLTAPITIGAPTGTPIDGQKLTLRFLQDATGRAITMNAVYDFGSDITAAMMPTTASAKFELNLEYNLNATKWRAVGIARGFTA